MSNVKILKLISGEEIVSEIETTADSYTLKNAVTIVYQKTDKGLGSGLAPYMPFATGDVDLLKHSVAAIAEPSQDMLNEYNRIFGAGIVVAPANDKILKV